MTVQISAVIITFNEESNIAEAIESVSWADDVVVVDSESSDRTREIAEQLGARVFNRPWPGFSAQKQFGVDQAEHDWIFSLDADERVPEELARSVAEVCKGSKRASGFEIARLPFYMGRAIRHGGWYPDRHVRMFDRRRGRWNDAVVHESIVLDPGSIVERLDGDLLHYSVSGPVEHHRMIGERYAPLGARQMFESGRTTSSLKAVLAGLGSFIKTYIVKLGFMDGFPGFCIAWFAAHHSFMKHLILIDLLRSTPQTDEKAAALTTTKRFN